MSPTTRRFLTLAGLLLTSAALVQLWVMMWIQGTTKITEDYWYIRGFELGVFLVVLLFAIWELKRFFKGER